MSSGHDEYWSAGAARERRSRARCRGEPRVLQRQRDVLEDALGAEHRRLEHAVPHADHLQGDALQRTDRSRRIRRPGPAPGATRASARPPTAGSPENALTGQEFVVNAGTRGHHRCPSQYAKLRLWRNTAVASLTAGQTLTLGPGTGTLGYEWDEDVDNGFRPAGRVRPVLDDGQRPRRRSPTTARNVTGDQHGDAPPHAVPRAERRAGLRRGHGAVVLGP